MSYEWQWFLCSLKREVELYDWGTLWSPKNDMLRELEDFFIEGMDRNEPVK